MMKWSKVIGVWCCFIPLAILNGGLREYVWHRFLSESTALALSGVLLAGLIYVVTFLLLPPIKDLTKKDCILVGGLWMFLKLLVNAAKFTEQGSIVLELKMADVDTALFSVTDTGCGIPPEKQHLIFERFEKLNDFVQGSGLGLSICQLIVKYMNGKLWVDSGYTRGARFCFTHPLKYNPALHGGTAQ